MRFLLLLGPLERSSTVDDVERVNDQRNFLEAKKVGLEARSRRNVNTHSRSQSLLVGSGLILFVTPASSVHPYSSSVSLGPSTVNKSGRVRKALFLS